MTNNEQNKQRKQTQTHKQKDKCQDEIGPRWLTNAKMQLSQDDIDK